MDSSVSKMNTFSTVLPVAVSPPLRGSPNSEGRYSFHVAQMALRVLIIALTLAGAILTATSHQSVSVFGIIMDARYTYSTAFRFKVIADSIVCGLTVLSLALTVGLNNLNANPRNHFYLLSHDLVSELVLISGCSAATAVGYVAKFGQNQTGWIAICDRVTNFCDRILVGIGASFLAVMCLLVLILMSAHKLKSL